MHKTILQKKTTKENVTSKTLLLLYKSDNLFLYDTNFCRKELSSRF